MSTKGKSRRAIATVVASAAVLAGVGLPPAQAASARAEPAAELTVEHNCVFPVVGEQKLVTRFKASFPGGLPPVSSTLKIELDMQARVNADTAAGLSLLGARILEGTAKQQLIVRVPQSDINLRVPITLKRTEVTPGGGFVLEGHGSAPAIKFNKPVSGSVDLGDMALDITALDSEGGPIEVPNDPDGVSMKNIQCRNTSADKTLARFSTFPNIPGAPPTVPQNVQGDADDTSATLTWDASTDPDGDLAGYEVYDKSGAEVADVTEPKAKISGLAPGTAHTFTIKAKDAERNYSAASAPFTITTTGGGTVKYGYDLKGSTFVKAPNGTAPLTGTIDADLKLSTGEFTADLALNPTKGDFKILGFLPVQAGIVLEPQGKTTGTLKNGQLIADSKVVTKLPSFTLFGVPLGGGENCKTTEPSDIRLTSEGRFEPLKGGKLKGAYALSDLKDCNLLTPILSIFTAGEGNTIDLDLAPKPRT
ncbi:fibronectin type III domain-containing protein [Spirillospora sp. NPDC127200]